MEAALESFPSEVQAVAERFFDPPGRALSLLGVGGGFARVERRAAENLEAPLLERVAAMERTLLDSLQLFAAQHDEIESWGDEYAQQLQGEVVATLVARRELWRCVRELRL